MTAATMWSSVGRFRGRDAEFEAAEGRRLLLMRKHRGPSMPVFEVVVSGSLGQGLRSFG